MYKTYSFQTMLLRTAVFASMLCMAYAAGGACGAQKGAKCTPKGDFEFVQCAADGKSCYCVDAKTGKEIPGTKKDIAATEVLVCQTKPKGAKAPAVESFKYKVKKASCKLPNEKGTACKGKKPDVKFYFDPYSVRCLAFEYQGCGGNDNKYDTEEKCNDACRDQEYACAGRVPPLKDAKGEPVPCALIADGPVASSGCPKDYSCSGGLCCNSDWEDKFTSDINASCPQKSHFPAVSKKSIGLIHGKHCSDNFCPKDTKCTEGNIFSFCCEFMDLSHLG